MTTRPTRLLRQALVLAALVLVAPSARAQVPTEGYDPMRQITAQLASANLLIVQDVTGSMGWDYSGNVLSYEHNSTGNVFWNSGCWAQQYGNRPSWAQADQGCFSSTGQVSTIVLGKAWGVGGRTVPASFKENCDTQGKCQAWTYVLLYERPSRLAIIKNAMGNAVNLVSSYVPVPFDQSGSTGYWTWTMGTDPQTAHSGWPFLGDWRQTPNGATVTAFAWDPSVQTRIQFWVYRIDYGNRKSADPGVPMNIWSTATSTDNRPGLNAAGTGCSVGTCTYETPKNVIGRNQQRVNWGLLTYSTNNQNVDASGNVRVYDVDPTGANANLTHIMSSYRLNQQVSFGTWSVADGDAEGLIATGSTNTRTALYSASADSTTVKSANNSLLRTKALADRCPAPYGAILVTDGESNTGNTSTAGCSGVSNYWSSCPDSPNCYPAGGADSLYGVFGGSPKVNTWAIGISPDVGRCELDFTSYSGRTDANSPRGDAGYSGYSIATASDPGNPYVAESTTTAADAGFGTHYDTTHGDNAFFPSNSDAISAAIVAIVNATATGDYATNAPVSGVSAGMNNMVYLPSTEYPSWKGHIYAFDTSVPLTIPDPTDTTNVPPRQIPNPAYLVWDAGAVLNSTNPDTRKIFTWDPAAGNALVEVTSTNLTTLQRLGGAGYTAAVVDFVRGKPRDFDGDGTVDTRAWLLGPMINSAPALVAAPGAWMQGKVINHAGFASANSGRDALLWVGANDGMTHAFRIVDGVEQIALVPPSLLATQVRIYQQFLADRRRPRNPIGQSPDTDLQIYGVANSFRFGDVWDPTATTYRTVGVITEGAGGKDAIAVDVTNVPRPDAATYPTSPVSILWTKNATTLPGLQQSWSIPAMAPASSVTWRLAMGGGYNPSNTRATQISGTGFVAPRVFTLDPTDGTLLATMTLTSSSYPPLVGNQAFADAVLFDPASKVYQDDNIVGLGLQADLNGQIWFLYNSPSTKNDFGTPVVGIDVSAKAGQSQPLYYSPSASGYGAGSSGCTAYAFGSGTLYERSPTVTGPGVGTTGYFIPTVYVATALKGSFTTPLTASHITGKAIASEWCVSNCDAVDVTKRVKKTFGPKTQLTSSPLMLVPRSGRGTVTALFLLYDPDKGCSGNSYVARLEFLGNDTCSIGSADVVYKAYDAGTGAASGFAVAGDRVLVSKSGIGDGQRAGLYEPPEIGTSIGGLTPRVKWWKELK